VVVDEVVVVVVVLAGGVVEAAAALASAALLLAMAAELLAEAACAAAAAAASEALAAAWSAADGLLLQAVTDRAVTATAATKKLRSSLEVMRSPFGENVSAPARGPTIQPAQPLDAGQPLGWREHNARRRWGLRGRRRGQGINAGRAAAFAAALHVSP
jgi:hypothetical protein